MNFYYTKRHLFLFILIIFFCSISLPIFAVCGNGKLEYSEDCEHGLVDGFKLVPCTTQGATCNENCQCIDTAGIRIMPVCGNSILERGEDCEIGGGLYATCAMGSTCFHCACIPQEQFCEPTCLNYGKKCASYDSNEKSVYFGVCRLSVEDGDTCKCQSITPIDKVKAFTNKDSEKYDCTNPVCSGYDKQIVEIEDKRCSAIGLFEVKDCCCKSPLKECEYDFQCESGKKCHTDLNVCVDCFTDKDCDRYINSKFCNQETLRCECRCPLYTDNAPPIFPPHYPGKQLCELNKETNNYSVYQCTEERDTSCNWKKIKDCEPGLHCVKNYDPAGKESFSCTKDLPPAWAETPEEEPDFDSEHTPDDLELNENTNLQTIEPMPPTQIENIAPPNIEDPYIAPTQIEDIAPPNIEDPYIAPTQIEDIALPSIEAPYIAPTQIEDIAPPNIEDPYIAPTQIEDIALPSIEAPYIAPTIEPGI